MGNILKTFKVTTPKYLSSGIDLFDYQGKILEQ